MSTEELLKKLEEKGVADLDSVVHEAASIEASFVNNQGLEEQIHYLITRQGWGHQEILDAAEALS